MLNPALPWWAFIARAALRQSGMAIVEALPCAIGKTHGAIGKTHGAIKATPKTRRPAES